MRRIRQFFDFIEHDLDYSCLERRYTAHKGRIDINYKAVIDVIKCLESSEDSV
jgi:hypothetical protein